MTEYVPERTGIQLHTLPSSAGTWEPPCLTCHEPIGYVAADGKYTGATECASCRAGSVDRRMAASGISDRELDEPLDALKGVGPDGKPYTDFDRWMAYLQRFAGLRQGIRLEPPFAFVCGNNGVGKSAGAQRALRDAIRNGCQGRFLRLNELLRSIYSTYGDNNEVDEESRASVIFYAQVPLLVIDEVGQTAMSGYGMGLFFEIVDDRWRNNRATIFTANYLPQQDSLGARMTAKNDERVAMEGLIDRLRGGSKGNLFVIRGKSWRGREEM